MLKSSQASGADSGISQQDVQDIMIAVAPLVGTAKVVSPGGSLMRALDLAITVAAQNVGS